jgi:shikimate kinase
MALNPIQIECRRPWRNDESIVLLGPGGVGKSTLGRELARLLGWTLIDLDFAFCDEVGVIGPYIAEHGYARYRAENFALAERRWADRNSSVVFVTSSGFLAGKPGSIDEARARRLVAQGYGISLMPSLDIDKATAIVVERQLLRGFGLHQNSEESKFRQRFPIYRDSGDMLVVTVAGPAAVAEAIKEALRETS